MKEASQIYNEKVTRIQTTVNHKEPDIVPIMALAESWVIGNAGLTIQDVIYNSDVEYACFKKMCEDFYFDTIWTSFLTRDVQIYEPLGGSPYFYSADGVTVQHKEYTFLQADDYKKLAADPMKFAINELIPRMYPAINKPYPENLQALKKSFSEYNNFIQKIGSSIVRLKDEIGMHMANEGIAVAPVDTIMSYLRGLKNTLLDIRRKPEEVMAAADALIPLIINNVQHGRDSLTSDAFTLLPCLLPTYLTEKQFGQIFWPSFKKMIDEIDRLNGKMMIFMEGNWEHLYDFMNELPVNKCIGVLEKDDIFKAKDKIGKTITIAGGMPLKMLRYGTKQECLDNAKKVINYCAPGGGYIFTGDKTALAPNDMNVENLKAVNAFAHEYGKYKEGRTI